MLNQSLTKSISNHNKGKDIHRHKFKELDHIVKYHLRKGQSEKAITNRLKSEGWPEHEVSLSLRAVRKSPYMQLHSLIQKIKDNDENTIRKKVNVMLRQEKFKNDVKDDSSDKGIVDQIESLKHEIEENYPKVLREEVKDVLKITDDLLGMLPDERVKEFVGSDNFETYKRIMKKVYNPLTTDVEGINKLNKVLILLEKKIIDLNEARKMLGLPIQSLQPHQVSKLSKKDVLQELKGKRNEN